MRSLVTALVLCGAIFIVWSQKGVIAEAALPRLFERGMAAQFDAELDDGLHVVLCGAGGPLPHPKRSGPCVAVQAGKQLLVFDAGTNGARNLFRLRVNASKINALFLSHFHSDHIDGLGEMAMARWVQAANTSPLPVIGPEGVARVVDGFNQAYAYDSTYRHAHHGDVVAPLSGAGMRSVESPLPGIGEKVTVYAEGDVIVDMFSVDHSPVSPAVGYLVTYKDRSVLISGDTTVSENVIKFAQGVDLLVHEALSVKLVGMMHDAAVASGNLVLAKITTDIPDYHTTPVEAAQIARDADVAHLLFYHVVPAMPLPGMADIFLQGVDEVFEPYTLGEDGTLISMPAGSDEITVVQSLL